MMKLILAPDADGYTSADGNETQGTQLQGGMGRYRRDKIGATKLVNVKWTMNPAQYQYWRAFFAANKHGQVFLCDLLSEDGNGPVEQQCVIIPGSVSLPSQRGLTYVQQAQLEVRPLPRDAEQDAAVIAVFEASDGNPEAWVQALARLATQTIPNAGAFQ